MTNILAKSNIAPKNGMPYQLQQIHNAVKQEVGVNPSINCYRNANEQYLNEIRLCFDRQLKPMDCDGLDRKERDVIGNCQGNKAITYEVGFDGSGGSDGFDGESSTWYTICAYFGLFVLIVMAGYYFIKDQNCRRRFYG